MNNSLTVVENTNQKLTTLGIEDIVNQFINSQDVRQSSKNLYRRTLKQFMNWIDKHELKLGDLTRIEILRYKEELLENGLSSLSVGSYLTIVRKFFEWAESLKYYPNIAKGIKTPKRKQQFKKQALTQDQSKTLLVYFESRALRDYAIVNLLLRTGLRTIELIRANVEDLTYKGEKRDLLVHGKGRDEKDDFVVVTDKCFQSIQRYLKSRGKVKNGEPLFTSISNNSKGEGRLTTRSISGLVKEGLRAIGINDRAYTAHSLRHTTGCTILEAGGSLSDAQAVLRHSDPATTQIYIETIKEKMRLKNAPEELIDNIF